MNNKDVNDGATTSTNSNTNYKIPRVRKGIKKSLTLQKQTSKEHKNTLCNIVSQDTNITKYEHDVKLAFKCGYAICLKHLQNNTPFSEDVLTQAITSFYAAMTK